jgi:hypothetical protein
MYGHYVRLIAVRFLLPYTNYIETSIGMNNCCARGWKQVVDTPSNAYGYSSFRKTSMAEPSGR